MSDFDFGAVNLGTIHTSHLFTLYLIAIFPHCPVKRDPAIIGSLLIT